MLIFLSRYIFDPNLIRFCFKAVILHHRELLFERAQDGEVNATVTTVTLLVDERQARRLAELEASNWTHISLVSRGDPGKADQLLETQEKVMENTPEETIDVWNMASSEQPKESAMTDSMPPTVEN